MEDLSALIFLHLSTVLPLIIFKLSILIVGYLIAKLGYLLLLAGVKGEFKFHSKFQGNVVDLISVSPGLFFILMATIMISIGIIKDKPFETQYSKNIKTLSASGGKGAAVSKAQEKPKLPIIQKGKEDKNE